MSKVILLKQNSPEIRDEIKRNKIDVCPCSAFTDAKWLDYYPSVGNVHGVGYAGDGMMTDEVLSQVEYEWKQYDKEVVVCKDVHEFVQEILKSKAI